MIKGTEAKMSKKGKKNFISLVKRSIPNKLKNLLKDILFNRNPSPKTCSLFMTNSCNLKCRGCQRNMLNISNSNEMNLSTVKQLLSLYPSIKAFSIAGFGEPTLCREFINIVEFLRKEEKQVNIVTNGTEINKLLQLNCTVDQISVSLYGHDNDTYRLYTNVEAYDLVIENFLQLKKHFNNIGLSYILTRENYRDLKKIIQLCDKLNPDFLHLINYLAYNYTNIEETQKIITVEDKKIINHIDTACKDRDYITIKPVYIDCRNPGFACKSYNYVINLDGNGNIGGCMRQIPPDSSFGNIFKEKNPFSSTEMKRLRKLQHAMTKTKKPPHKECNYCFGNWNH